MFFTTIPSNRYYILGIDGKNRLIVEEMSHDESISTAYSKLEYTSIFGFISDSLTQKDLKALEKFIKKQPVTIPAETLEWLKLMKEKTA